LPPCRAFQRCMRNWILLPLLWFPLLLTLSGCSETTPPPEPADATTWLPLAVGDVALEAQIALSQGEQQRGLMYRESLGENRGMLFPYPSPRRLSFWMANTSIPLDIGFFASDGRLLEVHRLHPFDTQPTPSRSDQVQFALEMNQGWFRRMGLRPGVTLDLDLLAAAMKRRGVNPADFGLPAP